MIIIVMRMDAYYILIPSGNQTWQWKILHLYGLFSHQNADLMIYRGFSIAVFDYRRVYSSSTMF